MKRNALIFVALLLLASVPMAIFIFGSGENEDKVAPPSRVSVRPSVPTTAGKGGSGTKTTTPGKATVALSVPVFAGYEDPRYQRFDPLIAKLTAEFNAKTASWAGSTARQAKGIPQLTTAQVKAHMIQETGGGDVVSRAAWKSDPLQVNVPGDWNPYKKYLGLSKPRHRNEGSIERNLRAGIMLLARKGFGVSGQPAANRSSGDFDGWLEALRRYNGRSDKAADGRPYRMSYADRIRQRAKDPRKHVPIPIRKKR